MKCYDIFAFQLVWFLHESAILLYTRIDVVILGSLERTD